jgi:hypothetical protein
MGQRAADEGDILQASDADIGDVLAASAKEAIVLLAAESGADTLSSAGLRAGSEVGFNLCHQPSPLRLVVRGQAATACGRIGATAS